MSTYITKYVKNILSGEQFKLEITDRDLERLEKQKVLVGAGQAPMLASSVEQLVEDFEFSKFPAFQDLLGIMFDNGFSPELATKILSDFGANEQLVRELLENNGFVSRVKPWFSGITCDGGRAVRTLRIVYATALACLKRGAMDVPSTEHNGTVRLIG